MTRWITLGGMLALLAVAAVSQDRADKDYQDGQAYIEKQQYDKAMEAYRRVIDEKGSKADAAMYWLAYVQNKAGKRAEALAQIVALRKEFSQSRWLDDARALEVELKQALGRPVSPESTPDEEMKLLAINSLMQSDPERSLPLLEKLLKGQNSPHLKERALFVLAQSGSTRARTILAETAKGAANPDLQRRAIEYLGVFGGKENGALLADVYKNSTDVDLKRRVLQSFMISGDHANLLALAKSEGNPDLRKKAVELLGLSGGSNELVQMYSSESYYEVKRAILEGLFLAGNTDKLADLAHHEKDAKLRRDAIRNLGLIGGDRTGLILVSMYESETDATVKRVVVEGLFIQGNAAALVKLARKETDASMKKAIGEKLSVRGSKEGSDYLMELLNK